jgi:hypothetical protein
MEIRSFDSYVTNYFPSLGQIKKNITEAIKDETFWSMVQGYEPNGNKVFVVVTNKAIYLFSHSIFTKVSSKTIRKDTLCSIKQEKKLLGSLMIESLSGINVVKTCDLKSPTYEDTYTAINCLIHDKDFIRLYPILTESNKKAQKNLDFLKKLSLGLWLVVFVLIVLSLLFSSEEKETPEEIATQKAQHQEQKRKGFHCLSIIDGANPLVTKMVKSNLREPESFEHISTVISPVEKGKQ